MDIQLDVDIPMETSFQLLPKEDDDLGDLGGMLGPEKSGALHEAFCPKISIDLIWKNTWKNMDKHTEKTPEILCGKQSWKTLEIGLFKQGIIYHEI